MSAAPTRADLIANWRRSARDALKTSCEKGRRDFSRGMCAGEAAAFEQCANELAALASGDKGVSALLNEWRAALAAGGEHSFAGGRLRMTHEALAAAADMLANALCADLLEAGRKTDR